MRFERSEAGLGPAGRKPRPFLWMSLGLHLLLLGALAVYKTQFQTMDPQLLARIQASEHKARQIQMQRKLQALEQMQRELAGGAPSSAQEAAAQAAALSADPQLMLERAKAIAARIDQQDQQRRAQELAHKAGLPVDKALERIQQADATRAASAPQKPVGDANRQISDLAEHARSQLAAQRQQAGQAGAAAGSSGKGNSGASATGKPMAVGSGQSNVGSGAYPQGAWNSALRTDDVFIDQRDYGPMLSAPPVDAAQLSLGTGRAIGSGGVFANRVFLDRWYIAGPFGGHGAASHDTVYPPELGVDLDAVYNGKNRLPLQWQYVPASTYPLVPPQRAENAVFYAYTEIRVDRDTNVWFNVGADDDSKMWVNDDLIWSSNKGDKPWYHQPFYHLHKEMAQYNLVEGRVRVHLHVGPNRVLFKLYNGIDLMFFAVVITP